MATMGVDTVAANLNQGARTYLWNVVIPQGNTQALHLRARSSSIPSRSLGAIDIQYQQTAGFRLPGKLKFDHEWQCAFMESEDSAVYKTLHEWQQIVINDKSGVGAGQPSQFKRDITLNLVKTDGSNWLTIKLEGAYPQAVGAVNLSQNEEGVVEFQCTFAYDRWTSQ